MSVELSFERPIEADDLLPLLAQTHWASGRGRDAVSQMLLATPVKLGAWQDDRLVGFVRALTDGRYRALIDDVVVEASLRGQGLGSRMLRQMADKLAGVEEVFLRCDNSIVPFYEGLGYRRTAICLDLVDRCPRDPSSISTTGQSES
jgi:ribosomal protein S18 acetylase RimI-like enzyme